MSSSHFGQDEIHEHFKAHASPQESDQYEDKEIQAQLNAILDRVSRPQEYIDYKSTDSDYILQKKLANIVKSAREELMQLITKKQLEAIDKQQDAFERILENATREARIDELEQLKIKFDRIDVDLFASERIAELKKGFEK